MPKIRFTAATAVLCLLLLPASALAQVIHVKDRDGTLAKPALPSRTVVLTFDDGPSAYTPEILDILKQKNTKATFFIVGSQAVEYPILKQIYEQGHEIGNHTLWHTDVANQPSWRMKFELNMTRIIIMSQTNHSTRLFRPPFVGSDALDQSATDVINRAADLGYVTVGETTDSEDWRRPGVQHIVSNATASSGGVILMHDGGGDRKQTVEALPEIIDYYQQQGFRFATVSEALGISRQEIMPVLSLPDRAIAKVATVVFTVVVLASTVLRWFILVLIIASFTRFILVTAAALVQSRRTFNGFGTKSLPCSILIPAYNESAVIESCLKSVLATNYPQFEVIVIDDGSKDNTSELARRFTDPRLRVLQKPNGGKASALNYGIQQSKNPFLIAIDADTIFRPHTVCKLMRHFENPKVGAVSGNIKIVNRHKLITKLQSIEYIVGLNLERRMGDLFDCITVVPGAVGAFRRSAIEEAGGFSFDTMTEDTDLTFSIKEAGHTILYDSEAIAFTEAPATIRDLLKQRFRWTFGTMQVAWKHRSSFLNPKRGSLGMVGLPYLLFFQIIFPLFGPFFDLALVFGLIGHRYSLMIVSFTVYTLLEVLTSAIALKLDNEKLRSLWILIPQRILYRQLMYYVIVRSFVNVLRGRLVHWGKLERKGTHLAKGLS